MVSSDLKTIYRPYYVPLLSRSIILILNQIEFHWDYWRLKCI